MSVFSAPLSWKRTNTAFKTEVTTGAPETLTAAEGKTNVFNAEIKPNTEKVERQSQGKWSPIQQEIGATSARCTMETELVGNGTTGLPPWAPLLTWCGLSLASQTATPLSSPTATGTIAVWRHGRLRRMSGAMGNFSLTIPRAKGGRFKWDFMGVPQPPGDVSQITPTYHAIRAPKVVGTFTIGGTAFRAPDVMIESGNVVSMREDTTAVDEAGYPTGYCSAMITDRKPIVRVSPEGLPLSTKDWFAAFRARTTFALSYVIGDTANNTFTIAVAKMELDVDPEEQDRNGTLADGLVFAPIRATDAGDDEYSILMA